MNCFSLNNCREFSNILMHKFKILCKLCELYICYDTYKYNINTF